jgi:hypothetical protein
VHARRPRRLVWWRRRWRWALVLVLRPPRLLTPLLRALGMAHGRELPGVTRLGFGRWTLAALTLVRRWGVTRAVLVSASGRAFRLRVTWIGTRLSLVARWHEVDRWPCGKRRRGRGEGRLDRGGLVIGLLRPRPAELSAQGIVAVAHGSGSPFQHQTTRRSALFPSINHGHPGARQHQRSPATERVVSKREAAAVGAPSRRCPGCSPPERVPAQASGQRCAVPGRSADRLADWGDSSSSTP